MTETYIYFNIFDINNNQKFTIIKDYNEINSFNYINNLLNFKDVEIVKLFNHDIKIVNITEISNKIILTKEVFNLIFKCANFVFCDINNVSDLMGLVFYCDYFSIDTSWNTIKFDYFYDALFKSIDLDEEHLFSLLYKNKDKYFINMEKKFDLENYIIKNKAENFMKYINHTKTIDQFKKYKCYTIPLKKFNKNIIVDNTHIKNENKFIIAFTLGNNLMPTYNFHNYITINDIKREIFVEARFKYYTNPNGNNGSQYDYLLVTYDKCIIEAYIVKDNNDCIKIELSNGKYKFNANEKMYLMIDSNF